MIEFASLTGKTRYRSTWNKKLILQVQEQQEIKENWLGYNTLYTKVIWRDGTVEDLATLWKQK